MAIKKSFKLTTTKYKELLEHLRHLPKVYLNQIAPLIWHINALDDHITEIERELRLIRQEDLFKMPKPEPVKLINQDSTKVSTAQRYYEIIFENNKEIIDKTLKWSKISLDEMYIKANEWAKLNGKNPLKM